MSAASRVRALPPRSPARSAAPRSPLQLLAAGLLFLLCAFQFACLLRAPSAWMPARITLALDTGRDMLLDGTALGLPPADGGRIRLRRSADGAWRVADAGFDSPLLVRRGDTSRRAGSALLAGGQGFQLGASHFAVDAVDGAGLALSRGATHWVYDGATLLRDGRPQPACADAHLGARLAGLWNWLLPSALGFPRPLVFGGNLDCGNRIAIAGLPAPAATVKRGADGMLLAGAGGVQAAPVRLAAPGPGAEILLAEREEDLAGASELRLGRTRMLLQANGDLLHLQPLGHLALYEDTQLRLPPGVSWEWTRRDAFHLPERAAPPLLAVLAAALAAAGALALGGRARRLGWRRIAAAAAMLLLGGTGIVLLLLQRSGTPAGAGIALLAAWAALWSIWLCSRGAGLLGSAAVLLLGAGLLMQLELGLGAPESSWLRHAGKTAAMLAIGAGAGGLLQALRPLLPARPMAQARVELGLLLASGAALLLLLLQVVLGDETGVFDLQPVEFAKLALAALSAHCLALATGSQAAPGGTWRRVLRIVAPALLLLVLLAVALVQVDDYSPLVLLAVWGGAMALAYALAARRWMLVGGLCAAAAAAVLAVVLLRAAGPAEFAHWNFYADRFLVWLDPAAHPHTGQQLLLGARAIADGGWFGADHAFGLRALGQGAGAAMRIPAVQDDFAPSFFLNRHGLAAGLLLWALQAAFVAALLAAAVRCWLAAGNARDFRLAWLARLRCFLLCGGASFVFGHFLLSWGTNLAIFPIMGQPMSFLSAGGSHLLFFICPLLAAGIAAEHAHRPTFEENPPCPSTFSTKP